MARRRWLALSAVLAAGCGSQREPKFDCGEPKRTCLLRGKGLRLRPEARVAAIPARGSRAGWRR